MRNLSDKELDAVCGGSRHSSDLNFQTNRSHNISVVVKSDANVIQGSNINDSLVVQLA